MSKEYLEALENLKNIALSDLDSIPATAIPICEKYNEKVMKDYEILQQALHRLEAIDNSNPNEALRELKRIDCNITYLLSECDINEEVDMCFTSIKEHKSCEIIKQALLKAQEKSDKEIAFDLVNEKTVDMKVLHWAYPSVEAYNVWVREHNDSFPRKQLTEEEFEFIGRLAGAK